MLVDDADRPGKRHDGKITREGSVELRRALLDLGMQAEGQGAGKLFLPLGHDRDVAARLRAIGWRTVVKGGKLCAAGSTSS